MADSTIWNLPARVPTLTDRIAADSSSVTPTSHSTLTQVKDLLFLNSTTSDLAEGSNLYYTDARVVSKIESTALSLFDGTTGTTQSPLDNSTKLATTAYVDSAVDVENLWDRSGTTLSPNTSGDDVNMIDGSIFTIDPSNTSGTKSYEIEETLTGVVPASEHAEFSIKGLTQGSQSKFFKYEGASNSTTTTAENWTYHNTVGTNGLILHKVNIKTEGGSGWFFDQVIGHNSADAETIYYQDRAIIETNTASSEDGVHAFDVMEGGTVTEYLRLDGSAAEITAAKSISMPNATVSTNLTLSSFTAGSVLYMAGGLKVAEDNDNLFYNNAQARLAIGTNDTGVTIDGTARDGALITVNNGVTEKFGHINLQFGAADALSPVTTYCRARGTEASPQDVQDNNVLMRLCATGYEGVDYHSGAVIEAIVDGTVSADTVPTELVFKTTATSAAPTTRLTIAPDGTITAALDLSVGGDLRVTGDVLTDTVTALTANTDLTLSADGTGVINIASKLTDSALNFEIDVTDGSAIFGNTKVTGSYTGKLLESSLSTTSGDYSIIGITDTSVERTVTLQTADTVTGREYFIKDQSGGAATKNITIDTEGGVAKIDGGTNVKITTNYGGVKLYTNGTDWFTQSIQ